MPTPPSCAFGGPPILTLGWQWLRSGGNCGPSNGAEWGERGDRGEGECLPQQRLRWPVQHGGHDVGGEEERREDRERREVGLAFEGRTAGEMPGEIPGEWQCVWQASTAGSVGEPGMALKLTAERVALDDPEP